MTDTTATMSEEDRLFAIATLRRFLDAHRRARTDYPDSAADLHLRLTGHRLAFGCCGPELVPARKCGDGEH